MHVAVAFRSGDLRHRRCDFLERDREALRVEAMRAALSLAHRIAVLVGLGPSHAWQLKAFEEHDGTGRRPRLFLA
jgi:hypothetical protein